MNSYKETNRNYVFNHIFKAISNILQAVTPAIESFQEWAYVYFVKFANGQVTFVSKRQVNLMAAASMAAQRKERAEGLMVMSTSEAYYVKSSTEGAYKLIPCTDTIQCGCKDWQIMAGTFKTHKVACKHSYALLGYLGYTTLGQYVKATQAQVAYDEEALDNLKFRQG